MAREYADDTSAKSKREYAAEPTPKEPGFKEKAGAFAYGLGTSTLGGLGDLEKFVVPEQLKGAPFGRETYLPTTEEAQKLYGAVGIPKPRPEVSEYQTAGEFAPAVAAGGSALYKLGKYGAGQLGKLFSGGKDLAEELKRTSGARTAEEISKAGERAQTAESRAAAAQSIAEREAGKPSAAYGQMPGVTTTTEAGVVKPIPQSLDEIGTTIKNEANKINDQLKATRQQNAEKYKGEAFSYAQNKEKSGAKVKDTKAFKELEKEVKALIYDPETKLAVSTLGAIKNPLQEIQRAISPRYLDEATGVVRGRDASFQSLEDLRRFLRDRSYGIPAEGFDAINQIKAGKLADSIEKVMAEFSDGKITKFISQYRKDSEPLRVFNTKIGKALTDEQLIGKGANYATVPAQSIPDKAFKSKEDYRALVDALGKDEKLAQQLGQQYFATKIEGVKDAKGIESFIRQNRTMLKETGALPNAERYAIAVRNAEMRGERAGEMAKTRTATATEQRALQSDLSRLASDVERAKDIGEINQQITNVANRLEKSGLITLEQRDKMLRDLNQIADLQKKREQVQRVIKWGLGGGTAYGAYSGLSGYLGK